MLSAWRRLSFLGRDHDNTVRRARAVMALAAADLSTSDALDVVRINVGHALTVWSCSTTSNRPTVDRGEPTNRSVGNDDAVIRERIAGAKNRRAPRICTCTPHPVFRVLRIVTPRFAGELFVNRLGGSRLMSDAGQKRWPWGVALSTVWLTGDGHAFEFETSLSSEKSCVLEPFEMSASGA